ncbi:MAG TPA: hypothetical protein VMZ27_18350 [Candidatus Saccharimonadales bacterium]|nr:hypothetical protein [Candidatus Saccharimonadales bacterium]
MIFGFNTDVQAQQATYHVQTEDRGPRNPVIESIIYVGGKILGKKRTSYDADSLSKEQIEDAVRRQHKELTESIRNGTWTHTAAGANGISGETSAAVPVTAGASYSIELANYTNFQQGEYFRFPILVRNRADLQPSSEVALEIRWIVDGMISDRQSLNSRADGGADVWVSAPSASQPAALLVRGRGSKGTSFAKFVVTQGN